MFMVPISNIYFYGSGRINSGNLLRFSAKQNPLSVSAPPLGAGRYFAVQK
jgi:hypothetical protein